MYRSAAAGSLARRLQRVSGMAPALTTSRWNGRYRFERLLSMTIKDAGGMNPCQPERKEAY